MSPRATDRAYLDVSSSSALRAAFESGPQVALARLIFSRNASFLFGIEPSFICVGGYAYVKCFLLVFLGFSVHKALMAMREKNPHAIALGKRGGSKGGKSRAARLTPEERSASARKAALARWAKVKKAKVKM